MEEDFEGSETIEDLAASSRPRSHDDEQLGFAVKRVDGEWYVSPIATVDRLDAGGAAGAQP